MTTAEWLYRAKNIQLEIDQLKKEKEDALNNVKITASTDGAVVSGSKDPHKPMDSIVELTELIDKMIDRNNRVLIEIQKAIDSLYDDRARRMMRMRYIDQKKWSVIYEEMNYSVRQCKRINKKAMHDITTYLIDNGKMSL